MTYVSHLNGRIKDAIAHCDTPVVFGQNVSAGSCLSGLTRGVDQTAARVINTPNLENTLVGTGFGLMLSGVQAAFFMKQQDFLLLGVDHLVNTYNLIRRQDTGAGSFTIVQIVVDSGYEGSQSALNNLPDLCSLARIDGYAIANAHDADTLIEEELFAPGFRIISVSQRLFKRDVPTWDAPVVAAGPSAVHRYAHGDDLTIVSLNFAFEQATALHHAAEGYGLRASLFASNSLAEVDWRAVTADAASTGRLVILDDTKSVRSPGHMLALEARSLGVTDVIHHRRALDDSKLRPQADRFEIDCAATLDSLGLLNRPRISLLNA
jgi:pyruvate/2-oxoglutarate/acetoin dehydrogenase E1 component